MRRLLLLPLLLVVACAPPTPPTPKPPAFRTVAVVAVGADTGSAYVDDVGGGKTCTLAGGYCEVVVHDAPTLNLTYTTEQADGFEPYRADAVALPSGNVQLWLGPGCGMPDPTKCINLPPLTPVFHPLPRLVTKAWYFTQADGTPITLIGADSYAAFKLCLDHDASLEPVLQQLQDLGFNYLRVFGSYNNAAGLGHFVPQDYSDRYFTDLPRCAQTFAKHGFWFELVAFADVTTWLPAVADQLAHWSRLVNVLAPITNALCEAVNENDQAINTLAALAQLPMPTQTNCSHGSNGSDTWGPAPFWHYVTLHTFSSEWQRKLSHNCYEIGWLVPAPNNWRGPCNGDEEIRPDQGGTPANYEDAFAACTLLNAGCVFHSNQGKASQLLTGDVLTAAQAAVRGAKKVPLRCQPLDYQRPDPAPGMLRTYARGSDPACVVNIRP